MCETILIDKNCVNAGDCDTCEKKETCTTAEAQESVNRALQALKENAQQ